MIILGIESSCDETAASVVRDGVEVLSNVISSQTELHVEYGGVVPEIASRAHVERMLPVVREALAEAGVGLGMIDAIAVGNRPGLIGCLLVGVAASKALAWSLGKPLIGVDHIAAHLYSGLLREAGVKGETQSLFPAIGLVVSGGHTSLYEVTSWVNFRRLGGTIDDAVGEAYDKAAKILELPYPGGPMLDRMAQRPDADERAYDLPISRLNPGSLDFSFSGLKTAVLYAVRGVPGARGGVGGAKAGSERKQGAEKNNLHGLAEAIAGEVVRPTFGEQDKINLAASFQRAASAAIALKVRRALDQHDVRKGPIRSLLVGGGVSANSRVRKELGAIAAERNINLILPSLAHCMDNGAMIAGLAYHLHAAGKATGMDLQAVPSTGMV